MDTPRGPLRGVRVAVTRPRDQAAELIAALEDLGAEAVALPLIRTVGPADPRPLRRAIGRLDAYRWVVFTSARGVERFWAELLAAGRDGRALRGLRIACIGPATAAAHEARGGRVDVVPSEHRAEALVDAVAAAHGGFGGGGEGGAGARSMVGARILLPLAADARPVLAAGLAACGAEVDRVVAYRTVPDAKAARRLADRVRSGTVDVVTFTSPSTVAAFVGAAGAEPGRVAVAVIGPVTAEAARRLGVPVVVVAREHTAAGLVRALVDRFGRQEPGGRAGV